jgi:ATP/maltotriose-dependent transcriptional regulator MalT
MPGLALLELDRGDREAAAAAIRRALQERGNPLERPALLAAAVDILWAANDRTGARAAADELSMIAAVSSQPEMLQALARHASGALLVREGDPAGALSELRAAAGTWRALRLPYEGARTAVMVGLACAALGDRTAADLELDNARDAFTELGAAPDLQHLAELTGGPIDGGTTPTRTGGLPVLSAREREVLGLVAAGKTNREIAAALVISQHTAGRHVENIFAKLGVTSRAAATAYAYENDLL